MAVDASLVKELRGRTGAGVLDCRTAIEESGRDMDKAVEILRKMGIEAAESRRGRTVTEGRVGSYVHFGSRIGVLLEIKCETDFVAKTQDFQNLMKNLCMHIAASSPKWVSREEVAEEVLDKEREVYRAQFLDKPEKVVDKIVEGKLQSFFKETCLLDQPYVKEQDKSVGEIVKECIGKLGENIEVRRFARFAVGE